mmetsp:Transcript_23739/g.69500  ORF Transcript_23739/g.69500 Transcript_23739/m.69500 type:complete len:261 (+) Transcript_23739:1064-1846(+)
MQGHAYSAPISVDKKGWPIRNRVISGDLDTACHDNRPGPCLIGQLHDIHRRVVPSKSSRPVVYRADGLPHPFGHLLGRGAWGCHQKLHVETAKDHMLVQQVAEAANRRRAVSVVRQTEPHVLVVPATLGGKQGLVRRRLGRIRLDAEKPMERVRCRASGHELAKVRVVLDHGPCDQVLSIFLAGQALEQSPGLAQVLGVCGLESPVVRGIAVHDHGTRVAPREYLGTVDVNFEPHCDRIPRLVLVQRKGTMGQSWWQHGH